jgi:rhodanese-related sulfurtransferase/rubrerythrin
MSNEFKNLSAPELRRYIDSHNEKEYLLVDVRRPEEYARRHIPGSRLLPVQELQTRLYDLPSDKDLILYCHSGGRSAFASDLVVEAELTRKTVYNLIGGILAWDGKTLADFPRIQIFKSSLSLSERLMTAMEMEKGAFRFYSKILEMLAGTPLIPVIEQLSKAETAHARTVYRFWEPHAKPPVPFEILFDRLSGEILEGGEILESALHRLQKTEADPCLSVLELALNMEYAAYDLYRVIAHESGEQSPPFQKGDSGGFAQEAFLTLAQAEKEHMKTLINAISQCPER